MPLEHSGEDGNAERGVHGRVHCPPWSPAQAPWGSGVTTGTHVSGTGDVGQGGNRTCYELGGDRLSSKKLQFFPHKTGVCHLLHMALQKIPGWTPCSGEPGSDGEVRVVRTKLPQQ